MARWKYVGPRLSTGEPERSLSLSGIPAATADGDIDDDGLTGEQMDVLRGSEFWKSEAHVQAAKTRKQNARKAAARKPTPKPAPAPEPAAARTDQPPDDAPPADSGETE